MHRMESASHESAKLARNNPKAKYDAQKEKYDDHTKRDPAPVATMTGVAAMTHRRIHTAFAHSAHASFRMLLFVYRIHTICICFKKTILF
jgi:hypothetical protein